MNRREFLAGTVTLPFALRFAATASAGGGPVALVTADTQSRVAVVELPSGKIIRTVGTWAGPRSIESAYGTVAIVCHTAHGAVSLIDGPTLRVTHIMRGSGGPRYTAGLPNPTHAPVADS